MDAIDALSAWAEEPDYWKGVALYRQYVVDAPEGSGFLLRMLEGGEDAYNQRQLEKALTARLETLRQQEADRLASYPAPLADQLEAAKLLMDERTLLKERLRAAFSQGSPGDEQSQALAFRILQITGELDGIYGRRRFYDQHGYLPDVAQVDSVETPADLVRRLHSVRTYVTKYTKQFNAAVSDDDRKRFAGKRQQYCAELETIEVRLREMTNSHAVQNR